MGKHHHIYGLILFFIVSLGFISFACCIVAEFKKLKEKDVRLVKGLCSLPGSEAFGFGIAGLMCLLSAETMGSFLVCRTILSAGKRPKFSIFLLAISWLSFTVALLLLSTAISMNRRQSYGKGWLDGDCYLIKDGVFICSALLVVVTVGCILASTINILRQAYDHNFQENIYPTRLQEDDVKSSFDD